MTAQKGSLVLIKVGDGGAPEVFTTIGGLRLSDLFLNNQPLESTHLESGAWRQLAGATGIRSLRIGGSGTFTNAASEETARGYAFSGTANNYQFIFANGNRVSGAFVITAYHRSGPFDGEESYALTLESAGTITFSVS